jgi:hypothetical protein
MHEYRSSMASQQPNTSLRNAIAALRAEASGFILRKRAATRSKARKAKADTPGKAVATATSQLF